MNMQRANKGQSEGVDDLVVCLKTIQSARSFFDVPYTISIYMAKCIYACRFSYIAE